MPAISMFLGIIIYMYGDDHNPPHFHASYQDYEAIFDFSGNLMDGQMPPKQSKFIAAWAELHHDELEANWQLAQNQEQLFKIEPLR